MLPVTAIRYILDTSILVRYIRDDPLGRWIEAQFKLEQVPSIPLVSIVVLGEIRSLALRLSWGTDRTSRMDRLVGRFTVVPLTYPDVIEAYAEIDAWSTARGRRMGKNDVWIAATARAIGSTILTTDKDFDHLHPHWLQREWIDEAIMRQL